MPYICFINSASWHTFEVKKTARFVPVASAAVHVTALCTYGMSDKQFVYADRECCEISTDVVDMQWRLFGHVLRLEEKASANQAMSAYFETEVLQGHRGRPRTSLPRTLDTDLQQIGLRLMTRADMEKLR